MNSPFRRHLVHAFFLMILVLPPLRAVEDNGNYNNNADPGAAIPNWTTGWPGSGTDGWSYVGQVNGASGTYLGNGWVITAAHVGAGNFICGGITYDLVSGSTTELGGGDVDLVLFRVSSPPPLPSLRLRQTAPIPFDGGAADAVAMIGYGGGYGKTWGFNTVNGVDFALVLFGRTTTDFYTTNGTTTIGTQSVTNNAELVSGDSGGGDFIYNAATSQWELAGLNEATGGASYLVELSAYVQQILDITGLPAPPAITAAPTGATLNAGSPIALSVAANGSSPLNYQWLKNGAAISGATAATFGIASAALADSGVYSVTITNAYGSITSPGATVSVAALSLAFVPPPQVAVIGDSVTFSTSVLGAGPFSYQWMLNGAVIAGATGGSFTIASVNAGSAGNYSVEVSNAYGSVTSVASPLIPVVSRQSIQSGQSTTFTAPPTGDGSAYQWQFNGVNLDGATGQSYIISDAQPSQAGIYTVVVTGPGGNSSFSYSLGVCTSAAGDTPALPAWALTMLALLLAWAGRRTQRPSSP